MFCILIYKFDEEVALQIKSKFSRISGKYSINTEVHLNLLMRLKIIYLNCSKIWFRSINHKSNYLLFCFFVIGIRFIGFVFMITFCHFLIICHFV